MKEKEKLIDERALERVYTLIANELRYSDRYFESHGDDYKSENKEKREIYYRRLGEHKAYYNVLIHICSYVYSVHANSANPVSDKRRVDERLPEVIRDVFDRRYQEYLKKKKEDKES